MTHTAKRLAIHPANDPANDPMKKENIAPFFATLQAANPTPETELEYTHALRAAGRRAAVGAGHRRRASNKATRKLFPVANTPQAILDLGVEGLEGYIKTIGLLPQQGEAPDRGLPHAGRTARRRGAAHAPKLEALPGVGRKTANVVLNVAFGEPTMAVDTHIFRVGNRTGLAPGKTPLEVELKLEKRVPPEYRLHAHHWLILHGRYVCVARKPMCWQCAVAPYCDYKPKTPAP